VLEILKITASGEYLSSQMLNNCYSHWYEFNV
jgi:hypothetical protein